MLYAPLLTAIIVYRVDHLPAVLLVGLATAAFFAQNALGLLLRERSDARTWRWLIVCSVVVLGGTMILWVEGHGRVLLLGVPAIVLLSGQALKRRWTRRQIDHPGFVGALASGWDQCHLPSAARLCVRLYVLLPERCATGRTGSDPCHLDRPGVVVGMASRRTAIDPRRHRWAFPVWYCGTYAVDHHPALFQSLT